jgi:hypothetical protein
MCFNRLFFKKPRNNVFRVLFPEEKKNQKNPVNICFQKFSENRFLFIKIMVQGHKWKLGGEKETRGWEEKFSKRKSLFKSVMRIITYIFYQVV